MGDSVQFSLRRLGLLRLGSVKYAMAVPGYFFRQELADDLAAATGISTAPLLALQGVLESADGSVHISRVNVYGIDRRFWKFALTPPADTTIPDGSVWVSQAVASRLGGQKTNLLIRLPAESIVSQDLIFSLEEAKTAAWPVTIGATVSDETLGRFGLSARQEAPLNVFVPIGWLAEKARTAGKANLLLAGDGGQKRLGISALNAKLRLLLHPEDLDLQIGCPAGQNAIELRSSRIFIEEPIARAALASGSGGTGILTYFVNEIRLNDKSVPYSMISGVGGIPEFDGLRDDEIVIHEWLADQLGADAGDRLNLTFFKVAPTRQLIEQNELFTVRRVVPMMGVYADSSLMPDFPGLAQVENCRDWKPGIPIKLDKIRPQDELYWDRYKGTPKAFVSLAAAQKIWANRFGSLTAVRWNTDAVTEQAIRTELMQRIDAVSLGFLFEDVRSAADTSASGSTDFAGLFAGLSMFLIFSAAVLLALVFVFHTETRAAQVGLLLACGWDWLRIFALLMAEGIAVALGGCAAGAAASMLYAKGLIAALNTGFWAGAVGSLNLFFHAAFQTVLKGFSVSVLICIFTIQVALYHRIRRPVHQFLTGTFETYRSGTPIRLKLFAAFSGMLLAAGVGLPWGADQESQAGLFFLCGTLLLAGFFFAAAWGLGWLRLSSRSFARSQPLLAVRNIPRRTWRSLAVLITLACGVFLVLSIGANYRHAGMMIQRRDSGAGGFALLAETTLPLTQLPSLPADPQSGLPAIAPNSIVGMRVYQQEEANCLNLNRVLRPTLLGVKPEELSRRGAFAFQKVIESPAAADGWQLLLQTQDDGTIPAIGDYATVFWGLGKKIGQSLNYRDEGGRNIKLKIVGILKDSVLQGRLLISEDHFIRLFPSEDGMRMFLIETDWKNDSQQAARLSRLYREMGMEAIPAGQKLAAFYEVENTYMAIFLVLGGFGLILGSAGLGLVLVLNILERRAELAMMQAVGFTGEDVCRMLFMEHAVLLAAGVICGLLPALLAVAPAIAARGQDFPGGRIALIIAALLVSGAVWIRVAVAGAARMNWLEILKNE
ncbi:MAG TPA: hypothetical protein PKW71_06500 [Anaerohalosphaeraceae bacterium]|nr:hypothetical protein [Anaerohalosphaeraceae bacterium]